MTAPTWEIREGDVLDRLREMPDESVHMVCASPPYWGLRDYGTASWDGGDPECGHKAPPKRTQVGFNERYFGREYDSNKQGELPGAPYRDVCGRCGARRVDQQIGLEATPGEYVARMVAVFAEVRRVLRSDGTCWVNLGDSYAGGSGGRGDAGNLIDGKPTSVKHDGQRIHRDSGGLKPKDLVGMPWRVAFELQADGWWLRSEIIWAKPNPMPESVTDRPTKAHEQIFLLTKAARYYYDADAVREASDHPEMAGRSNGHFGSVTKGIQRRQSGDAQTYATGRNARSVWTIATAPWAEAHFATFPPELPRRCILAGTSERGVCPACGAPWRRVVERAQSPEVAPSEIDRFGTGAAGVHRKVGGQYQKWLDANPPTTTGWEATCAHALDPIPATVLDPFAGSGTTLMVAVRHGRSAVGIELNPEYAEMARRRILADHGAVEPTNGHTPAEVRGVQGRLGL